MANSETDDPRENQPQDSELLVRTPGSDTAVPSDGEQQDAQPAEAVEPEPTVTPGEQEDIQVAEKTVSEASAPTDGEQEDVQLAAKAESKAPASRQSRRRDARAAAKKAATPADAPSSQPEDVEPHDELQLLREMYEKHRVPALVGLCAVIALIVGIPTMRSRKAAGQTRAMAALGGAQTTQDLEGLVAQHPSTPAGNLAVLLLAKMYYNAGSYELALTQYTDFLDRNSGHELAAAAEMGRIHCTEAMGQTDAALADFTAFARKNPDHYLAPQAVFARGRCLEQLNRHEEARAVYEDFILQNPESEWLPRAEELLDVVQRQIARQGRPLPAPLPVPVPPVTEAAAAQTTNTPAVLPISAGIPAPPVTEAAAVPETNKPVAFEMPVSVEPVAPQ